MQTNILGEPLQKCSMEPITGYFRDGSCRIASEDFGNHSVCAIVTNEFLEFSKKMGNDLLTPRLEYGFVGLKNNDKWCLCANRWREAYEAGCAPKIDPNATSMHATKVVPLEILMEFCIEPF